MRDFLRSLTCRLRRLALHEQGIAAVEFALILPIMLTVYIGSVEGSALITMDRRIQTIAGTLGDLVARSDGTISSSNLNDYFQASSGIMTPFPVTDLEQTVTQIEVKSNGSAVVVWSYQYKNGTRTTSTRYPANSAFTLPAEMTAISKGSYVIASEARYSYLPLSGIFFKTPVSLFRENYFMPRFDDKITVN